MVNTIYLFTFVETPLFLQAFCNLWFEDLLQIVEITCSRPVDNKFWHCQATCNTSVENLQQACRQQAVASHANASWYRLCRNKLLQVVNRLIATCASLALHDNSSKYLTYNASKHVTMQIETSEHTKNYDNADKYFTTQVNWRQQLKLKMFPQQKQENSHQNHMQTKNHGAN